MSSPTVTRRLAAIVIADVVGYTRLMESDDSGTFARLRSIRDEVVDPAIVSHDGRIVKTAGDGLLAEFPSALAALRASVHIQREMAKLNESVATDERIDYRIGINLGDIMVDGSDIVGDGVNVASRLESLAEPGGICASGSVREQVHGTLDVRFDDIGEQRVKNIARPIRAFSVRFGGAEETPETNPNTRRSASRNWRLRPTRRWGALAILVGGAAAAVFASRFHLWPFSADAPPAAPAMSVGVVPLVAPPGDPAQVQRAATLTRDITTLLSLTASEITAVQVWRANAENSGTDALARSANVRYLIEGDLRPGADATQVGLRLVDGSTKGQVWSEILTLKDADPPAVQRRVVRAGIQRLAGSLWDAESRRVMAQQPGDATAMDYVVRAWALNNTESDTLQRAREMQRLLEEALRRDPNLAPALTGLATALDKQNDNDLDMDHVKMVQRMDELTAKAVNLNGSHADNWVVRAGALWYKGQWNAALEASAKAIRLDPDAAHLIAGHAWFMSMSGRPAEAVALLQQAIAMDPPGGWAIARNLCEAYLLQGQYPSAIAACEKAKGLSREDWMIDLFLAAAYAQTGELAKASGAKSEVLRHVPGYTIAALKSRGYSLHPDYLSLAEAHWYSGLRKAGFPEQ